MSKKSTVEFKKIDKICMNRSLHNSNTAKYKQFPPSTE